MSERIWQFLAWHVPAKLVYFCVVRAGAYASQGQWSGEEISSISIMKTLQRWSKSRWGWT